jgi:DNA polymerase III sliding clamp (beta) subunit (PCNA family)
MTMTVTATKTIQFNDLMKVFTKFVGKSESRPVLKNVYFDGKYFYGTDSHKLLRVNSEYVSDIPTDITLYDPKNIQPVNAKMNYPDCSRLIPIDYNSNVVLDSNIKDLHKHVKEIKKIVKKDRNHVMKIEFYNNETKVSAKNETDTYSATVNNMWADEQEITLHLSANYLNDAIETIKKLSKVSYNTVQLGLISHLRPMNFYQENVFDIIILPVRTY